MTRNPIGRLTVADWQLFSSMRGSGAAARAMTKFLREELKGIKAGDKARGQRAYYRWVKRVENEGLAKWGALDTEPLVVGTEQVERILRLPEYSIDR